jgi:hypothetical protein
MSNNPASTQRFFYHCFPQWIHKRRESTKEIAAVDLLRSILRWGLLLTPESIHIPIETYRQSPDGQNVGHRQEISMSQCRVCFTELTPKDIPKHCGVFGQIALEFDHDVLINAGAMPVFYLPAANRKGSEFERFGVIGKTLVYRLEETFQVLSDLADIHETMTLHPESDEIVIQSPDGKLEKLFERSGLDFLFTRILSGRQPLRELAHTVDTMAKLFYPADAGDPSELVYYREREWRIFAGPQLSSGSISQPVSQPTADKIVGLIEGSRNPYTRERLNAYDFLAHCELLSEMAGSPFVSAIRRILVPPPQAEQARVVAAEFSCQDKVETY